MNQICVDPDFILGLLEEIGRQRALADHETDIIEAIVTTGHRSTGLRNRWTPAMDKALLSAASKRGGIKSFAAKYGISRGYAYVRLHRLREVKLQKAESRAKVEA